MKKVISFLSLFGSLSTLLCCALPVLFVTLGMGAVFASITATFPQLYFIIEKKDPLFLITGFLLTGSYFLMKKAENLSCPTDINKKEICQTVKPLSQKIFRFSVTVYLIGAFTSYLLPLILEALD